MMAGKTDTVDTTLSRYRMDHAERGKFIIINNKTFQQMTGASRRTGTDVDADSLVMDFIRLLGFTVERYDNLTTTQMLQLMITASAENHENRDCLAVAVLTHGEDGKLFGVDGIIPIDSFIGPIKSCSSLEGKPKIFLFQACRGTQLDPGQEVQEASDAASEPPPGQLIQLEADFLYVYSTTPGYFAWRNKANGSWFVQALHRMLEKFGRDGEMDFVRLLTRVNRKVAYEFESSTQDEFMNRKKQIPSIVSKLTKDIYLTPKK